MDTQFNPKAPRKKNKKSETITNEIEWLISRQEAYDNNRSFVIFLGITFSDPWKQLRRRSNYTKLSNIVTPDRFEAWCVQRKNTQVTWEIQTSCTWKKPFKQATYEVGLHGRPSWLMTIRNKRFCKNGIDFFNLLHRNARQRQFLPYRMLSSLVQPGFIMRSET